MKQLNKVISVHNTELLLVNVSINDIEDECPLCKHKIDPIVLNSYFNDSEQFEFEMVLKCPNGDCNSLFLSQYAVSFKDTYSLQKSYPKNYIMKDFSEIIKGISPNFVQIYNQALAAEEMRLDMIIGVGYRKALEFLIKDYLIYKFPDDSESIVSQLFMHCVNKYFKDTKIKSCIERATWLGNDETHYTRKWIDKDIKDLKLLIDVVIAGLENELYSEKYVNEMQKV